VAYKHKIKIYSKSKYIVIRLDNEERKLGVTRRRIVCILLISLRHLSPLSTSLASIFIEPR
jgi:hypothetical protein